MRFDIFLLATHEVMTVRIIVTHGEKIPGYTSPSVGKFISDLMATRSYLGPVSAFEQSYHIGAVRLQYILIIRLGEWRW